MIRNYFLVAIRNLFRNKFFSAINIFGLAVSMTICMAIIMLIADQMMYDRHNSKRERIYRINNFRVDEHGNPAGNESATSPMPLRDELLKNYTGVEQAVRVVRGFGNGWLEFENQNVNVPLAGFFADPEVLDFFEYELEYGDASTALVNPYSVVITKKAAKKLFKQENPIGESIKVGDLGTYTVTGVLKDTDHKSHIVFEALASMASVKNLEAQGKFKGELENWANFWNGWNYVLLDKGKTRANLQASLEKIFQTKIATVTDKDAYKAKILAEPLMDITPGKMVGNPIGPFLPWIFVYFLGGISAIIMLTSCFNFTNLSIARSLKRAKEIGVRKVSGAGRSQIFTQFLSESLIVAGCALLLALLLLAAAKPFMLQLNLARLFRWDLEANYLVFAVFIVFTVVVGLLAGFFPAVVLSGFQPIKVLKNVTSMKLFSRVGLRKSLLVIQFTVSLIFILSVIVMYNQLQLFINKDYGFNSQNNIVVKLNNTNAVALKTELLKYPNIKNVSAASHIPSAGTTYGHSFKRDVTEDEWTAINYFAVDEDYLQNIEVILAAGRFFNSEASEANKRFIVINEEALNALHYKSAADAIGQALIQQHDSVTKTIIGVVKNYNHSDLLNKLEPMALTYAPDDFNVLQIRYEGPYEKASSTITQAWHAVNPGLKIDQKEMLAEIRFFYDTIFGDFTSVLGVVSVLAVIISCLGLLGMATYTIESRVKEISIRKVLGATDQQLVFLLSKGFFKLLVIAVCIGAPLAWFLNNLWLELIAYHTSVSAGVIISGALILLGFGALTIGSQTLRATYTNPVDNMKSE
jgi:putative ABC transport system permease protein